MKRAKYPPIMEESPLSIRVPREVSLRVKFIRLGEVRNIMSSADPFLFLRLTLEDCYLGRKILRRSGY